MTNATHFQENSNSRTPTLCSSSTVLGAFLVLILPATALADGPSCSLSRAAANWTFTDNGTVIGAGPRTALGKFALTATGLLLNGVATSSLNGTIAEETFSGTYTVNPDCTGTVSGEIFSGGVELFTVTLNIVFDRKMERLQGIFTSVVLPNGTSLPTVIAFDARRD